jgi:two-component system, NarL family, sensor histidine kinase DesK
VSSEGPGTTGVDDLEVRDPMARYGWVLWAPWTVFLIFPLVGSSQADEPFALRIVGVALTLAFLGVYAFGWHRLARRCEETRLGPLGSPYAVLGVLVVLAVATAPVIGLGALSFVPFVQAYAMFSLPVRVSWAFATVVLVGCGGGLAATSNFDEWGYFVFILFAVTMGTGAGRLMDDQGERYAEVRDRLSISAERERVARDVHDVLGHSLTVVTVKADLAARLVEADPTRAKAELEDIQRLSRQALAEIRATVGGLRAAPLSQELVAARSALRGAGIEPVLPPDDQGVDPRYRPVVGWVLREAVTNVVRHSGARRCEVQLGADRLAVRDDGRGINGAAEGNGLRGLRERVTGTGGRLTLGPGLEGHGTSLEVTW